MCTKCKQILELSKFSKDSQKSDGLSSRCRVCRSIDHAEYAKKPGVREHRTIKAKLRMEASPEVRKRHAEAVAKFQAKPGRKEAARKAMRDRRSSDPSYVERERIRARIHMRKLAELRNPRGRFEPGYSPKSGTDPLKPQTLYIFEWIGKGVVFGITQRPTHFRFREYGRAGVLMENINLFPFKNGAHAIAIEGALRHAVAGSCIANGPNGTAVESSTVLPLGYLLKMVHMLSASHTADRACIRSDH